jgi:hypothetical protein
MGKEKNFLNRENNNINTNKLINNSYSTINEELKSIQRVIALLRQDIKKIIHDELRHAIK